MTILSKPLLAEGHLLNKCLFNSNRTSAHHHCLLWWKLPGVSCWYEKIVLYPKEMFLLYVYWLCKTNNEEANAWLCTISLVHAPECAKCWFQVQINSLVFFVEGIIQIWRSLKLRWKLTHCLSWACWGREGRPTAVTLKGSRWKKVRI